MKDVLFLTDGYPDHVKSGIEEMLFNEKDYLAFRYKNINSFFVVDSENNELLALVHFDLNEGIACSLPRAPFAGIIFSSKFDEQILGKFLSFIETELAKKGVVTIQINSIAEGLFPQAENVRKACVDFGYTTEKALNHHIVISDCPFFDIVDRGAKRKLKKADHLNFKFERIEAENLEEVYGYINDCRRERGIKLSMTFDQLRGSFAAFPERYLLFGVKHQGRLIAATISVVICDKILYNFSHANKLEDKNYSPIIFLLSSLYDYCREANYTFMDLGISTLEGKTQESLAHFKERVGGVESNKYTFSKRLGSGGS